MNHIFSNESNILSKITTFILSKITTFHWLLIIFFTATFLRAIPIIYLEFQQPGWHSENINEIEFYYDDVARSVIAGKGFVHSENPRSADQIIKFTPGTPFHFVPPLYAWWLSLLYFIFGPNVFIAKLFQCLLDSAVCLLVYKLGKKVFERQDIALLAACLYAIYPLSIVMCTILYYQIPLNLAVCWLLICVTAPINLKNGFWSGIALGISALAKPVTLPLLALFPIIKFFEALKQENIFKSTCLWSLAFLFAALITLAPWTIRNYLVFHEFVPVQHGGIEVLIQGSREEYIDLDVISLRQKYGYNYGVDRDKFTETAINNHLNHLMEKPLDYIRFLTKKFSLSWYNTEGKAKNPYVLLVQIPFLIFAVVGLLIAPKIWFSFPHWYILGMVLYICAIQVALFPLARYTLAIMPLVMIMTSYGLITTLRFIFRRNL